MKLFGREFGARTAVVPAEKKELQSASHWGYFGLLAEYVTGGWQRNLTPPSTDSVLAFSAVYACVTLIANDISKLRLRLMRRQSDGTWREVGEDDTASPFLRVIRKPNHYETGVQFRRHWVVEKLVHGNNYALKQRVDRRGLVTALYNLDPTQTTPFVAANGEVYYRLGKDRLSGLRDDISKEVFVPASEIIHDRMPSFWHPLIGVSPIYACAVTAGQGNAIQENARNLATNGSQPKGILAFPQALKQEQVDKVKTSLNDNYTGENVGKFAVMAGDVKWIPMTMSAAETQAIEQLRFTVEDVARCFHVPPYKLGLQSNVTFSNAGQLNQDYYSQCLQELLENFEASMDEGLELPSDLRTEFDLDGLMRMDPVAQADIDAKEIGAAVLAPNEARIKRNLRPMTGGDKVYLQQQNYSLEALAKRDSQDDPFGTKPPAAPPAPAEPTPEAQAEANKQAAAAILKAALAGLATRTPNV